MLSEIKPVHKKDKQCHDSTHTTYLRGVKFIKTESRVVGARVWRRGHEESVFNDYRVSVGKIKP